LRDWKCAEHATGKEKTVLTAAAVEVEGQEGQHLYDSKEWRWELWVTSLGFNALLLGRGRRRQRRGQLV